MNDNTIERPLLWVASSKDDLMEMPQEVISEFGYGLYEAQLGEHSSIGKVLTGFGGANVVELVMDRKGDTFRAVYTVRFKEVVVVLHAFQKKSKKGIKTPKQDMDLINSRLKLAEAMYKEWKSKRGKHGQEKETDYEVTEGNVFAVLSLDQPEELLARAKLLHKVGTLIKNSGLSQQEVAKKLGITQSKVSMLVTGRLTQFSTDSLLHYLSILGCEIEIHVKKPRSRIGIFRHKGCIAVCGA